MKATDFYFSVSLFIMLYLAILLKIKTALPALYQVPQTEKLIL